ncbi:MAG: hypothetical protein SF172_01955 [Burkholderiales bacterium]|nr:hypothetical protein [Burkholderiales bacterium]
MMRAILLLFTLLTASGSALAQLEKLFFSPEERRALDLARDRASRAEGSDYVSPYVDGVVQRSDGKNTIWVNGKPFRANEGIAGKARSLPADPGEQVSVTVSNSEKSARQPASAPRRPVLK